MDFDAVVYGYPHFSTIPIPLPQIGAIVMRPLPTDPSVKHETSYSADYYVSMAGIE